MPRFAKVLRIGLTISANPATPRRALTLRVSGLLDLRHATPSFHLDATDHRRLSCRRRHRRPCRRVHLEPTVPKSDRRIHEYWRTDRLGHPTYRLVARAGIGSKIHPDERRDSDTARRYNGGLYSIHLRASAGVAVPLAL